MYITELYINRFYRIMQMYFTDLYMNRFYQIMHMYMYFKGLYMNAQR